MPVTWVILRVLKNLSQNLKTKVCYTHHINLFQQLHYNSANYNTTTHMTRNIHCMISKVLFEKTDHKFLERQMMAYTLCRYSLSRATSAEPPAMCGAAATPPLARHRQLQVAPHARPHPGRATSEPHKQTQTYNTYRVWVHKSCWTKSINSTLH